MYLTRKEQWIAFISVNATLLLGILLFPFYDAFIAPLPSNKCGLLTYFHLYCPACGGTRALRALLELDLLTSLRCHPMVLVCAILLILYEIGMIRHLIKGGDRDVFVKPWMIFTFLGVWGAYSVIRNLLLLYGIDLLGNVL